MTFSFAKSCFSSKKTFKKLMELESIFSDFSFRVSIKRYGKLRYPKAVPRLGSFLINSIICRMRGQSKKQRKIKKIEKNDTENNFAEK